jgi:hypothetical protein
MVVADVDAIGWSSVLAIVDQVIKYNYRFTSDYHGCRRREWTCDILIPLSNSIKGIYIIQAMYVLRCDRVKRQCRT